MFEMLSKLFGDGNSEPLQGLEGRIPKNTYQGSVDNFGGVPGSIRSSAVGMPGYQAEAVKYQQSLMGPQESPGSGVGVSEQLASMANLPQAPLVDPVGHDIPGTINGLTKYKLDGFPKLDNIKDMITAKTQELGTPIPIGYFHKMAQIESGYNPTAVSSTGAKGLYQFIGSTWKQYGTGNPLNPVSNTEAAIKFTNDNYNYLSKKAGRSPSMGELYAAHNIGPYGALRLMSADPNMPVTKALIGSKPAHNPRFLQGKGGKTITARQALENYRNAFSGVK